jgi:hypothetical protein
VPGIFCVSVSSESNHYAEPSGSLTRRSSLSSPLDSDIPANAVVSPGIEECGEASQACAFGLKGESTCATHRDV